MEPADAHSELFELEIKRVYIALKGQDLITRLKLAFLFVCRIRLGRVRDVSASQLTTFWDQCVGNVLLLSCTTLPLKNAGCLALQTSFTTISMAAATARLLSTWWLRSALVPYFLAIILR